MEPILTLERIKQLRVDETMIAYVGNLEQDISRCNPGSAHAAGTPTYKYVLLTLQEELLRLERMRVIELTKIPQERTRKSRKGQDEDWKEYIYQVKRLGFE